MATWTRSWLMAALPLLAIAAILIAVPLNWPQYRGVSYLAVLGLLAGELAVIGGLISGRPEAYSSLERSSARFPCREEFLELARSTGGAA